MFIKNQKVIINNNNNNYKIISNQNKSTPGIYKIFNVIPNTNYQIKLINYNKGDSEQVLWISGDRLTKKIPIKNNIIEYQNTFHRKIRIGILFVMEHFNKYFELTDILIEQIQKQNSKISLIIPCWYKHFQFLLPLLRLYEQQTLLPDEVVVVIANSNKLDKEQIDIFKNEKFKFETNIIEIPEISFAGNSRLVGLKNSKHDIIIFQDVDDIPHKQRVEIIKYYFDRYPNIVHICHKWSKRPLEFYDSSFEIDKTKYIIPRNNIFTTKYRQLEHVANGNIAIRKYIIPTINWYSKTLRKQDILTNIDIYNKYRKTLFIREEIYLYRSEYSSSKVLLNQKPIVGSKVSSHRKV